MALTIIDRNNNKITLHDACYQTENNNGNVDFWNNTKKEKWQASILKSGVVVLSSTNYSIQKLQPQSLEQRLTDLFIELNYKGSLSYQEAQQIKRLKHLLQQFDSRNCTFKK